MALPVIGIAQNKQTTDFDILDSNQDGIINPYEALDVLLMMSKDNKENIRLDDIAKLASKLRKEQKQEVLDMLKDVDKNKNDIIEFSEADDEVIWFLKSMDKDKSKSVTKQELFDFNFEEAFFLSEKDIQKEIKQIFNEFTSTETITLRELNDTIRSEFEEWDLNRDGQLSKQEAFDYMKADNSAVEFRVEGDIAFMTGCITATTPAKVLELIYEHPNVKTIEMIHVPGSIDDVANLRASLYVHQFGLNIRLNERSIIASGGTDFFLAGKKREVTKGAKIGVHSWSGGAKPATELSKNHKSHKKYLEYYKIVNIPAEFYWYTLEAASADDIHFMTEEEIELYNIKTN
jgi:Ca2+-binding EF-hand superfamily protein